MRGQGRVIWTANKTESLYNESCTPFVIPVTGGIIAT